MQEKSDVGQSPEPTGQGIQLVANILEIDGWDGHHWLDHHRSIDVYSESHL